MTDLDYDTLELDTPLAPAYHHLKPLDTVNGFKIRPGFYDHNGAWAMPNGVSFTVHSQGCPGSREAFFTMPPMVKAMVA